MSTSLHRFAGLVALALSVAVTGRARADVTLVAFGDFTSDELYGSWVTATIDATSTNYVVTATGYGSNYKLLGSPGVDGTGATLLQLDVTLSGPSAAEGKLGPIVDLVDADGTQYSYRWYGQSLGHRVLKMSLKSPTQVVAAGTTSGLDLSDLQHLHLQLDPGGLGTSGAYTVAWNDLRLTGFPALQITAQAFNRATREFTLTWRSLPGKTYAILGASELGSAFASLASGIASGGATTSATVVVPEGASGFLQIQQE